MSRISSHLQRHPKSGIYYFRLTIPEHLRSAIGKREIKKSLRTGLRSEATLAAMRYYVQAQELFQRTENIMTEKKKKSVLEYLDELPPRENGFIQYITVSKKAADGSETTVTIDHGDLEKEKEAAAHLLGVTAAPQAPPQKQDGVKLGVVIRDFVREKKALKEWQPKTVEENQAIFQLLKEILRNPAIETISYEKARKVKSTLLQLPSNRDKRYPGMTVRQIMAAHQGKQPLAVGSVRKYLGRISSLFGWAKKNGYCSDNPFQGMTLPKKKTPAHKQRDRFTKVDLDRLFNPDHFGKDKFRKSYCFWLPLLGLYSGARINELSQLHLDDICDTYGVHCIDVNSRHEKRLKTTASERLIPIHSKLIELGFLEHVEALRKQGEKRLFPELKRQRDGYSQTASKWFGRYRKKCGVDKPFHSFRHTFVDELRQLGANQIMIAALVGHTDSSETGGRYGKSFKPYVLRPVVELFSLEDMK